MAYIDAKEITLEHLLSQPQNSYQVPIYQRPYAWEQEQWRDLFEDISLIRTFGEFEQNR